MFDELRVVTAARWVAQDLARAGVIPVVADLGLDVVADISRTAWWCSGGFAARLGATGHPTAFLGPTAQWQAAFPEHLTGREVHSCTVGQLRAAAPDAPAGLFAKPADVKIAAVPARWWQSPEEFLSACDQVQLADSTPLLWTTTRVNFDQEHRCFIAEGRVVAASVYLAGQHTWDAWDTGSQPPSGHAVGFAEQVLDELETQPPGWVLDVGQDTRGRWCVVEANPAWAANPYHADPVGVVRAILASQDPLGREPQWAWDPGEHLRAHARPLPTRAG